MKEQITQEEHIKIKRAYQKGQIANITPVWHVEKSEIDFEKQGDKFTIDLWSEGYSIIFVNIESLISKFDVGQMKMYSLKKLYNKNQEEEKISLIVRNWINGVALIPPTILCRDSTMSKFVEDSDFLLPQDGKHRINVAYSFGEEVIPIIVMNKQISKLKNILGIG